MSGAPKRQARAGGASGGMMGAPKVRRAGGTGGRGIDDVWVAINDVWGAINGAWKAISGLQKEVQAINIKIEGMSKDISWLKWVVGVSSSLTIGLLLLLLAR